MRELEKQKAILLRQKGKSVKYIAKALGVGQGSVSGWVADIKLTDRQISKLKGNSHSTAAIEKRRSSRLKNEQQKRQHFIDIAGKDIKKISRNELRLIGTALYWAEGRKRGKRFITFSNSDHVMVKVMMRFFREICSVPETKFRGHIHTYSHLNSRKAEHFWSKVSGISLRQFYKTYSKPSTAGRGTVDSLPYGTLDVYVCDVKLFLKIQGWTEKIKKLMIGP